MNNYLKKYGLTNNDFEREVERYNNTNYQLKYLEIVLGKLSIIRKNFIKILVNLDELYENTKDDFSFTMIPSDNDDITSKILIDIRESKDVWDFENIYDPLETINKELYDLIEFVELLHIKITSLSSFRVENNLNFHPAHQSVPHRYLKEAVNKFLSENGEKLGFKIGETMTQPQIVFIENHCSADPLLKPDTFIQKLKDVGYRKKHSRPQKTSPTKQS